MHLAFKTGALDAAPISVPSLRLIPRRAKAPPNDRGDPQVPAKGRKEARWVRGGAGRIRGRRQSFFRGSGGLGLTASRAFRTLSPLGGHVQNQIFGRGLFSFHRLR